MKHIALWSGPRNISTALMYSFAQRPNVEVFDEPLYGYFLAYTSAERPDRQATMDVLNCDGNEVLGDLFRDPPKRGIRFTKNIANQIVGLNWEFMKGLQNIILIREPERVIHSYTRQIENPTELDLAYAIQRELYDFLSSKNWPVVVLDSKTVLKDPEGQLIALCEAVGIKYEPTMLSWPAGARPEDGPWARYWYQSVHRSTGFAPYNPTDVSVPKRFTNLFTSSKEHYDYLAQHAL